jgi:protein-disulfide isomerase
MSADSEERLTRKQRRERARADRRGLERQESQRQKRRRRLLQLGGVAGAAVVVIIVIVVISASGGGGHPSSNGTKPANDAVRLVDSELAGIPQSGNVLGRASAPVAMQEFGDLQCPICKQFALGAFPTLIQKYVRTGKLKIEFHSMQTATREPSVFNEQQVAAVAAGKQNLMWYYVELFYHQQGEEDSGYVTPTFLHERAEQVPGLSLSQWEEERRDPKLAEQLERDKEAVGEHGFTGTPSFVLGKTGGASHTLTSFTAGQLDEASALFAPEIEKALKS